MTAHPPRTRWHVETYDPVAAEWSSGTPFTDAQAAIKEMARRTDLQPAWPDGTPRVRRIVLETTTFEDLHADVHLARFPKAGFVLPCVGGQDLAAVPGTTPDGRSAIRFSVGSSDTGHAEAVVPLELLEEVIAGLRDMARQAGGQPGPLRRRLTELEHDRAWHAIDGGAGEDGADPGTVLAAVLHALGIDPPAGEQAAPARPTVVIHEKPADEAPIVVVRPGTEGWIRV